MSKGKDLTDLTGMLRVSLRKYNQHKELDKIEEYIEHLEFENMGLTIALGKELGRREDKHLNYNLLLSQYENMKLMAQLNVEFCRMGFDPLKPVGTKLKIKNN